MEYSFVKSYRGRLQIFGYNVDKRGLQPEYGDLVAWRKKRIKPRNGGEEFTLATVIEIVNPAKAIKELSITKTFENVQINTNFLREKAKYYTSVQGKDMRNLQKIIMSGSKFFWVQGLDNSDPRRNGEKIYIDDLRTNNERCSVEIREISDVFIGITLKDSQSKESQSEETKYQMRLFEHGRRGNNFKDSIYYTQSRFGHSKNFSYITIAIDIQGE